MVFGLNTKDSLTIVISFLTLLVTIFVNVFMQIYWNRRKLSADLKSKSRIEWIQTVRKLTSELLGVYYRILSYEKPSDYVTRMKPSNNEVAIMMALNKEIVPVEHTIKEDNIKELLIFAQEKTQLLMLYYGSEFVMESLEFDIKIAREILLRTEKIGHRVWIDVNDGKNGWMSLLLMDTYNTVATEFNNIDDLNSKISKAREKHMIRKAAFIEEATNERQNFNIETAERWHDENNKYVDNDLLEAMKVLDSLEKKKQSLYERLDFLREVTSIYLKHEWERAKKGK